MMPKDESEVLAMREWLALKKGIMKTVHVDFDNSTDYIHKNVIHLCWSQPGFLELIRKNDTIYINLAQVFSITVVEEKTDGNM